jgi:uncharacterized protein with PIN domain
MTKQQELCLECNKPLDEKVYAVYRGNLGEKESEEEVAGFLCEKCRTKKKIKPIHNRREWDKLEKLKQLLNQED